jgi:membrane peptidoglycan carboxypeptidase
MPCPLRQKLPVRPSKTDLVGDTIAVVAAGTRSLIYSYKYIVQSKSGCHGTRPQGALSIPAMKAGYELLRPPVARANPAGVGSAALWGATFLLGYLIWQLPGWSYLESLLVSRSVATMDFRLEPGASPTVRFPRFGPYDLRLGYTALPEFIGRLRARGFDIEQQARPSRALLDFMDVGGYAVFHEKTRAGLTLSDRSGHPLEAERYPTSAYQRFGDIPPILVDTIRFIEDRDLLEPGHPWRNPAVEWRRLALAAAGQLGGMLDHKLRRGGASTLATQIEKFRHSPDGRTEGMTEKLRQMITATARAYLDGPQTTGAQQEIITSYLNSTPLGSRPGYGEVVGLGDGLLAWYGADFALVNRLLGPRQAHGGEAVRRARVYKQALSLLIALRRPTYYLNSGRPELERLTNAYLRALAAAGVIDRRLRDAALRQRLEIAPAPTAHSPASFVERKATNSVRTELMEALGLPELYSLDRLDLSAGVSIDGAAQKRVAAVLAHLGDPAVVATRGLVGDHLLGEADPAKVAWSVVLCERGRDRNLLRIHVDSLNRPFDVNSGAKLMLGSTAKLRTLATYLNIVEKLQRELSGLGADGLRRIASTSDDPLRRWAAGYLAELPPDRRGLQSMLGASMQRRYSANPSEVFFTGGGTHVFHNFEASEDGETPTVEEAFEASINLVFVRLLRDVIVHFEHESGRRDELLRQPGGAEREKLLRRFADEEGRAYLERFYAEYGGLLPDDALDRLSSHARPGSRALAILFRSVRPDASIADLQRFLAHRLTGGFPDIVAAQLYSKYDAARFSLNDRAYVAGVHPLEIWLVAYLQQHPGVAKSNVIFASAEARQQAYSWLFKTRNLRKQDLRLRVVAEEDAFDRLLQDWKRQGYPFGHLVPSLATAIGSSGDRPDALATLMGIILNDGVRLPTTDLVRVRFAADTPFDTTMVYRPEAPRRVMSPDVATTLRRALIGVVENGTGSIVRGVYVGNDGVPLAVGGKTGTGDNRFDAFGPNRRLIEARPVDRTATFAFFLGDRYFGTVTAFVSGKEAGRYQFSSALAVSLLKALAPELGKVTRREP